MQVLPTVLNQRRPEEHIQSGSRRPMRPDRRHINEFRSRTFGPQDDRLIAFVCECTDVGCHRTVELTRVMYDDLLRQGKPILCNAHAPDEDAALAGEQREPDVSSKTSTAEPGIESQNLTPRDSHQC